MQNDTYLAHKLQKALDHDNFETREGLKTLFKDNLFVPRYSIPINEERKLALQRLKKIVDKKLISVMDFESNPNRIFTAHEIVGQMDGSAATKMTVQFNLFGGTLLNLGNNALHKQKLKDIDSLKSVGCFGLTELGYGNNAAEMQTTATYNPLTKEFTLNTPNTLSRKYWITNGALHAHYCIVFAKLIINNEDEGIHAFLVPIRDKNLKIKEGVSIWDMGHKIGINGIDNASIGFNNVKISKDALLGNTSSINEKGKFESTIIKKRDRFLYVADRLLSGRLCIASMMIGASKYTLDIAINYANKRLAVGKKGKSDNAIFNFQLYQRSIMPMLAKTFCYNLALNYIKDVFANKIKTTKTEKIILCCGAKAVLAWHNERVASLCRERSGGQGYLSANRMGEAIFGSHSGITAEGDNAVLMQKVSKELLGLEKNKSLTILGHYLYNKIPSFFKQSLVGIKFNKKLKNSIQLKLLKFKKDTILSTLAINLKNVKSKEATVYEEWMYNQSDEIQLLAKSYFDYKVLSICDKYQKNAHKDIQPLIKDIKTLYFLSTIETNMSWYLTNGVLSRNEAKRITKLSKKYCKTISQKALLICKAFGIPDHMKLAPMYNDIENFNSFDNRGELIKESRNW